jgi:glutathione S-transferase
VTSGPPPHYAPARIDAGAAGHLPGAIVMTKILYSSASPYSAKVRMAAAYAGIALDSVSTDTNAEPAQLIGANPLGKIPVLLTDEGLAVYDSRAITQYLNRESKNRLFPRNPAKRTEAEVMEALADGICDCLLAHVYERRFRPEEKIHQDWLDKQWAKAARALDALNAAPPKLPKSITAGQIAVRATLGYLALRFEGKWERGRPRLKRWAARFDEKFPELVAYLPK